MEHAIKHAISAALDKMEEYVGKKDYKVTGQLADDLFEILFPGHVRTTESADIVPASIAEVTIPMSPETETKEIAIPEVKPKKPRAKKPVPADPVVEDLTEKMAAVTIAADTESDDGKKAKKTRGPMTDEQKAAAKAKRDAKKKGEDVSPPPSAAPAVAEDVAPAEPAAAAKPVVANLEKLTPNQKKVLAATAAELFAVANKGDNEKFLAYVNGLSKADFDAKKPVDHMRDFYKPPKPEIKEPEEDDEGEETTDVTFKGKTYVVATKDKRVFVEQDDGSMKHVGVVGMAEFAKMVVPE
jgi:hypothetical protein